MTPAAQPVDLLLLAPAIVTALGALVVLLADVLRPGAGDAAVRPAPWLSWMAVGAVAVAAVPLAVLSGRPGSGGTFCLPTGALEPRVCSYDTAWPTLPLQWLVLAGGLLVVLMSADEVVRRRIPSGEYHFLLLASLTGALVLVAARDLATAVVALETVTLPLVAMVGLSRRARGAQASLSLYLSSVVSLAVSLYGIGLLYSATGSLHYEAIGRALLDERIAPVAALGTLLVLAVFVFKVAAVPFQAWAPDTYAGSPVPVAAYLSVVSKTAGLGALVVLLSSALRPVASVWGVGLGAVVVATFVVGNVLALRQGSLVRLLAWSSVAQLAYVLLPVAAAGLAASGSPVLAADGAAPVHDAVSAALAYLAAYAAMTVAAWSVTLLVARRVPRAGGVVLIEDLRGLARTSPWLGGAMVFAFACLAGLPPGIVGLVVKVRVFQVAVGAQAWLLVAVAVLATVVALAYYLRVAAVLLADPGRRDPRGAASPGGWGARLALAAATAVLVLTSLAPALLLDRF